LTYINSKYVPVLIMKTCRGSGDTAPLRAGVNIGKAGCNIMRGRDTNTTTKKKRGKKRKFIYII